MGRTGRVVVAVAALAVCTVPVVSGAAGLPGIVVAHKSVSGSLAVTAVTAAVPRPQGLWVRLVGKVTTGTAVVACTRGSSISSNAYPYRAAGLYRVPVRPTGAEICDVVASVGGSGRVTVEIRAAR
jgi:hypothetical protein